MTALVRCNKLSRSFTKRISVDTNDPSNPKTELVCKGRILEPLVIEPKRNLRFDRIPKGTTEKRTAVLKRGDGGPIKPTIEPLDTERFSIEMKEVTPGEHYEMEVTFHPPNSKSRENAKILVNTGVSESPSLTYYAYATFVEDVVADPKVIRVPLARQADWQQEIKLVWNTAKPYRVRTAKMTNKSLAVEVIEREGQQKVFVKVPKDFSGQGRVGLVTIHTADPQNPSLKVPIFMANSVRNTAAPKARAQSLSTSDKLEPRGTKPQAPKKPGSNR